MYYLPQKKSAFDFSFLKKASSSATLGITISDGVIQWVALKKTGDKKIPYKVVSSGAIELNVGVIIDTVIKKPEVIIKVLKQIRKKSGLANAVLVLVDSLASTLSLHVTGKRDAAFQAAIRARIEEQLPTAVTKTVFYHTPLDVFGKKDEVLVRVIPAELLKIYRQIFQKAGILLEAVDVESDALARLVTRPHEKKVSLVVHIGEHESTLAIVGSGFVYSSLSVPIGGEKLLSALQKSAGLTTAAVEKVKKERGFIRAKGEKEVLYGVALQLDKIIGAIKELSAHWHETIEKYEDSRPIEQVILSGSEVTYAGIQRYLAENIVFPVVFANVWLTIFDFNTTIPPIVFEESLSLASAIGAAVEKLS